MIDTAVGQLVADRPSRSRVFQRLGIDFCCGGKVSLAEACRRKGLDAERTLAELLADQPRLSHEPDPAGMGLSDLCDHIETTHHAFLRRELPRLRAMVRKVSAVHGENHAWLRELVGIFEHFATDMDVHMMKEELILFPAVRMLEAGVGTSGTDALAAPMRVMEQEHEAAGDELSIMRTLSSGFVAPEDACTTFRALLDGLRELEEDLHLHVHKENNVLFPRALAAQVA